MPRAQRLILVAALVLGVTYAWLRGAFVSVNAATVQEAIVPATASVATFAAGCFWSAESAFEGMPGVLSVVSGYTGGSVPHPTYKQVSAGATGHAEAVEIRFDASQVTYAELLDRFWHQVDLFTAHKQFCDIGDQYRPAIFVRDAGQREVAESSRERLRQRFGQPIKVEVTDAGPFYRAEEYHQNYAARHPIPYRFYRWSCGRDARLSQIWQH